MTSNTNGVAMNIKMEIMLNKDIMNYLQSAHTVPMYDKNRDLQKVVSTKNRKVELIKTQVEVGL